ncbi:MAG: metallophosphoesterase [Bacteroidales bacterium]|nr:metallophosphoesterase [Bacteroidales bacterium]
MAQVVFLSDAHLGSGADTLDRERQLCRFLDTIKDDCSKLFLLGDIFDFWFSYRHLVPRGHTRLLGKLAELADSGVEIHFFVGNHDMWVFDYLTAELGIITHEEPGLFDLCGKRVLVGHGDGLGHTDRWFDFVRLFFRSRLCQRLFKLLPSALTFGIAHRWSDANKRKHQRNNMRRYLGDDREGIVIYCKQRLEKEHIDYCIFGHRHTPLTRDLGHHCTYLNTGDWFHNRNYALLHPDGSLELKDFLPNP